MFAATRKMFKHHYLNMHVYHRTLNRTTLRKRTSTLIQPVTGYFLLIKSALMTDNGTTEVTDVAACHLTECITFSLDKLLQMITNVPIVSFL
jgi:hypothetical protein